MPPGQPVVPQVTETDVTYQVTYLTSSGTTLSANSKVFFFSGNSVFNPDLNVTLESYPIGHFQWAFLYQRFQVISSQITVTPHSTSTIPLGSCRYIVLPKAFSLALPAGATQVDDFSGEPLSKETRYCGPVTGSTVSGSFRGSRSTAFMLSRPPSQLFCSEDHSGYNTSNALQPQSLWYWIIVVTDDAVPITTGVSIPFTFRIKYRVRYYQPHGLSIHKHEETNPAGFLDLEPCLCDEEAKAME